MRLYSTMRLLSVSWPCMASLYQRHNSIASVLWVCVGKSCISRFLFLGLFLTSLLKPFEENLTVTILIKLKRVLLHGHFAKMELIKWNIHIENVEGMWMMWT